MKRDAQTSMTDVTRYIPNNGEHKLHTQKRSGSTEVCNIGRPVSTPYVADHKVFPTNVIPPL